MRSETANKFQTHDNKVFLAGDAAHVFPPAGGFGMNTGIQDVHNLAWKIAYVLGGRAGESLLETYDKERRPVSENNSKLSLNNWHEAIKIPKLLGLDPNNVHVLNDIINQLTSINVLNKVTAKNILEISLNTGRL